MTDQFNMQRFGSLKWEDLSLEPSGNQGGVCDCCGTGTQRVWGFVRHPLGPLAAYFVGWTLGKKGHGAAFDLVVGWGEGALPERRAAVSLQYRVTDEGPGFGIVDASGRPTATKKLVGRALARSEVVDTALANQCFAIADAVLMKDPRIAEVRGWA
jgi:hypothetical protein